MQANARVYIVKKFSLCSLILFYTWILINFVRFSLRVVCLVGLLAPIERGYYGFDALITKASHGLFSII